VTGRPIHDFADDRRDWYDRNRLFDELAVPLLLDSITHSRLSVLVISVMIRQRKIKCPISSKDKISRPTPPRDNTRVAAVEDQNTLFDFAACLPHCSPYSILRENILTQSFA
jgi:hypothetical protein